MSGYAGIAAAIAWARTDLLLMPLPDPAPRLPLPERQFLVRWRVWLLWTSTWAAPLGAGTLP